ncbi:endonuclease/exonuclease/phosphatase family protein [Ralstonia sp. 24A2]|uniref:endonuclease/exonuclease/phosphatase family protein n=1 Tax=Ralstonia sp. 24A2 TaxID=3447364 RepID=UPI003F699361
MNYEGITTDIARGLLELRARIVQAKIPSSKLDETLNIATWNVREFGRKPRTKTALYYIAEILRQFDLIGLQEVRDNLGDLKRVLDILGPDWRAVYSDAITDAGGNRERIAYVYDRRAVAFTGLAAQAQPPRTKRGMEYLSEISWWRRPYMVSFHSGNFDFVCISAHIRWGNSERDRLSEIEALADWVYAKAQEKDADGKDLLVMGDFNVPSEKSPLFQALTARGLRVPDKLLRGTFGSNLEKNKRYDQILQMPEYPESFTNAGGVLDFYQGDHTPLFPRLTKQAMTYQLSDHLPLWVQINTNTEEHALRALADE